ncbi:MAG TPA: hypothetical protein VJ953_22205 [Saprospiraceae bacterium]|nr:hypothetical protein [Saprospiraceae bacterium]
MRSDIPDLKVEGVAVAIVPRKDDDQLWDSYLINLKEEYIENVLVNSRGYGQFKGDKVKTTILRHFFEQIKPNTIIKIEPIQVKLFGLTNEYWVSFSYDGNLYDKKYVFVRGSIDENNFTSIPYTNWKGVMIR